MPRILLCGAEGEQFLFENELTSLGADDKRRGSTQLLAGQQMFRQFDSTYNDFWVHFRLAPRKQWFSSSGSNTGVLMEIRSGTKVIARVFTSSQFGSSSSIVNFRFDTAETDGGSLDQGPIFPHLIDEFINYDIRVQTRPGSFTVSFYRNEVLRHTVTKQVTITAPSAVLFKSRTDNTDVDEVRYQDIIITDALPTVGMELATLTPSAVGSFSDFTNDYAALDDLGYNQSTVISTSNIGDRESWFFSDPEFDLGDKVIYGLAVTTVAQVDLAGVINDFEPFVRINATNYPGTPLGANSVAPNAYTTVFDTNPATGLPWTQSDLVGLESGLLAI